MDYALQSTFGVRSAAVLQSAEAYQKHRKRVNRGLKKLRRSLKIHTKDTKNYANKEKVSKITSADFNADPRFGDVLLATCERDLLHVEETRILMAVHPSKTREKFIVTKYKSALASALQLLLVSYDEKDEYKRLETLVYAALIQGSLCVARKQWKGAIHAFSVARCSLQFLYAYNEVKTEGGREIYTEIVDTYVDPALRLALSKDSNNKTADLDNSARQHCRDDVVGFVEEAVDIINDKDASYVTASDADASSKLIKEVQWSQYSAPLKSEDVARKIMSAQEQLELVRDTDAGSFDPALLSWQEALQTHRQEMDRIKNEDEDEAQDRYIILTYINYSYLILRIRRDAALLESVQTKLARKTASNSAILENTKDAIRLVDGILNTVAEIKELPGVGNDDELSASLATLESFYTAKKIFHIYNAYLISDKFTEALALIMRAYESLEDAKEISTSFPGKLPSNADVAALKETVAQSLRRVHVLAQYAKETSKTSTKEFVTDNLNKCLTGSDLLKKVAPLDVDIIPVPVKPVLFDIAFNYIGYNTAPAASTPAQTEEKKKGIFGLFGR